MLVLIFFSSMWASCIMTQSSHPFGEEIKSYSYLPSFPSGPYLSRGGLFLKTVSTIVTSSLPGLSVGSAFVVACVTAGLVFAETCMAVDLMFVDTCVAVGLVFGDTCMAVGLLLVVTCMTIGLEFVETYVTVGLVFAVTCMAAGLGAVPSVGFCALLIIQAGQNQTLLLFGILFLPDMANGKTSH